SIDSAGLRVGIDYRVLTFAAAVSLVVGILAALLPALLPERVNLIGTLRERTVVGGVRAALMSNLLIGGQIALGLVLLTAASLLSANFLQLRYLDLGYDPHGLYRTSIAGTR